MIKLQLSRRERAVLAVFLALLAGFSVHRLIYLPAVERNGSLDARILLARKRIGNDLATIRQAGALEKKYGAYLEKFRQTAPDSQVMTTVVSTVESVGSDVGMRILDLKPQKVRKTAAFNNLSVNLIIEGELADILHFIHVLQGEPYDFDVGQFELSRKSPRESVLKCRFVLEKILLP